MYAHDVNSLIFRYTVLPTISRCTYKSVGFIKLFFCVFIALRATRIVSAINYPIYSSYDRLFRIFCTEGDTSCIGYDSQFNQCSYLGYNLAHIIVGLDLTSFPISTSSNISADVNLCPDLPWSSRNLSIRTHL